MANVYVEAEKILTNSQSCGRRSSLLGLFIGIMHYLNQIFFKV